ncbi:hypothetical protein chiPu_0017406 [Chiloscyllium punctatum]|uniref:Ig-like domain-containing protein n=1 Tax=Chiloscyllium punctatum TaxID=137246 RepID=A0A401RFU5_CHIPU|nr:hypothetical protein [Chiloscyllium punctatum]
MPILPFSSAGCKIALILQWGNRFSVGKGKTVEMHCYENDTSRNYMYWYRQYRTTGLQLIATSAATLEPTFEEDFKASLKLTRRNTKSCSLKILQLQVSDTVLYFCAAGDHRDKQVQGICKNLTSGSTVSSQIRKHEWATLTNASAPY